MGPTLSSMSGLIEILYFSVHGCGSDSWSEARAKEGGRDKRSSSLLCHFKLTKPEVHEVELDQLCTCFGNLHKLINAQTGSFVPLKYFPCFHPVLCLQVQHFSSQRLCVHASTCPHGAIPIKF